MLLNDYLFIVLSSRVNSPAIKVMNKTERIPITKRSCFSGGREVSSKPKKRPVDSIPKM